MSPLRKLELAWKFRGPLWKYRRMIRYRKQIFFAAAVGVGAITVAVLMSRAQTKMSAPPNQDPHMAV
jgi:hypothetical protein